MSASYTAGGQRLRAVGHSFTWQCAIPPFLESTERHTRSGPWQFRDERLEPFEEEHPAEGLWQLCLRQHLGELAQAG